MLRGFIDYAQLLNHFPEIEKRRPAVTKHEAECFIYVTGVTGIGRHRSTRALHCLVTG